MKELIDLLREARHELDSSHYINNRLSPLAKRIDAALAAHEAEPERKCRTCRFQRSIGCVMWERNMNPADNWFCADWETREIKP